MKEGVYNTRKVEAISASAIQEIEALLETAGVSMGAFRSAMDRVGLDWLTKHGSWPKRLSKALKIQGIKIDGDTLSRVGKIARESVVLTEPGLLEISRDLDWEPGAFGDDDSCFFASRRVARTMIPRMGGFVLFLYDSDGEPLARALCVPAPRGRYVLFNCYCRRGRSENLFTFARLLSDLFDLPYYREVDFTINGVAAGPVYINLGRGVVVGDADVSNLREVDLTYRALCEVCGNECYSFCKNDSTHILCWPCTDGDETVLCHHCDELIDRSSATVIDGDPYCKECVPSAAFECDECGALTLNHDGYEVDGHWLCPNCVHV